VQMDANENMENFPIIYTMGPVSNGVLQPHPVRLAHRLQCQRCTCCCVPAEVGANCAADCVWVVQPSNGNSATLDLSSATLSGVSSGNDRRDGSLPTVSGLLISCQRELHRAESCSRLPAAWHKPVVRCMLQVHGWLNAVGLGLLLPLAAAIARTLREHPKVWAANCMHQGVDVRRTK
jgi:hypothetical protein